MQARDRLIVAADLSSRDEIVRLVNELHGIAGLIKIGLEAFVANGPSLVRELIGRETRVFLDLKLHDIPNTVERAAAEVSKLGVSMLTVHAAGGEAMLRAAGRDGMLILGVTILTSLDSGALVDIGLSDGPVAAAARLALLSKRAGLRGVVASPQEIGAIRDACGREMVIVTPGIRPAGVEAGDQKRVMTPGEAIRAGANYIVVGRPITQARNRRDAAMRVVEEIERAG
jgi:orotidine-5'-phosphate decarboxylase